jgi:hypothetical protein
MRISKIILLACLSAIACQSESPARSIVSHNTPPPPCPVTPAVLAPSAEADAFAGLDSQGTAIYVCRSGAWASVDSDDVMTLVGGGPQIIHRIGSSFAWPDGSSLQLVLSATVGIDAASAPWQLFNVVSHGPAFGALTPVTQLQRLSTVGGGIPGPACTAANAGASAEVPYTARFFLYQTSAAPQPHQRCGA